MPDGFEPIGSATSVVPTVAASADDLSGAGRPASGRAGGSRDDQTTELMPSCLDVARLAVGSFLARYREPTLTAYTQDLRAFPGWRQTHDREPLRVTRGELEIYVRDLESRGYAAATVARRFGIVATFYTYVVIYGSSLPAWRPRRAGPKLRGRARSARCCTRWSSPPCSPPPASPARTTTPWCACSACSGSGL
jgi:hypothetical protein